MRTDIKLENWAVLAGSITELLDIPGNRDFAHRAAQAFRAGKPGDYVQPVVAQCRRCVARSWSATERARAQSLLETLGNYGLI